MKLVLIDSGIDFHYSDSRIVGGCSIESVENTYIVNEDYTDKIGHGTAVTDIALSSAKNIEVYMVKICDADMNVSIEKLCYALKFIYDNLEYDVIQISAGVLAYSGEMHGIIKQIVKDGTKSVIAAFDNEGGMSFPAAFDEVIGVDIDRRYSKRSEFDLIRNNLIDIRGGNDFFRVKWLNNKKTVVNGTSFLTSYFSALFADGDERNYGKETLMKKLEKHAYRVVCAPDKCENDVSGFVKQIKKAIAFPFNKEIHSIAAFEEQLPFEVEGYYDIRHKFLIGMKIKDVLKFTENEKKIQNYDMIDWDADFDTVICGHVNEISRMLKKDVLQDIIEKCAAHGKRLYCFDDPGDIDPSWFDSGVIFSPRLIDDERLYYRFGKLYTPNKPVLAVMGTSSKQGKFTTQLSILSEFRRRGIKVDGISTEPQGPLLGFSEVFAFGYNAKNYLSSRSMIHTINEMVHRVEVQDAELILTGCQSGTIAYDMRNESLLPVDQHNFLLGMNPDGVILCVNEIDDAEYIGKTVRYIEAASDAKIIAIILCDTRKIQKDNFFEGQYREKPHRLSIGELSDLVNLPVFPLSSDYTSDLVDCIMNYYA